MWGESFTCPLCLVDGAVMLADRKGRPYLVCSCSRTFIKTRAGLRAVGMYSKSLRYLLEGLNAAQVSEGEQYAAEAFDRTRASGAAP